jgi:hypothetical protein
LETASPTYYGKVLELREAVERWLEYIPQTFPHYTRHTVSHSEEVIRQVSKLLFHEEDPRRPVVRLSPTEAYILLAASYLHDAGMVVSDDGKASILQSEAWKRWTTDGSGARRWAEVDSLRKGHQPEDEAVRHFLADVQGRFLIAEFVRRTHHRRTAALITEHEPTLARFAFNDPALLRTISDICVSHGLSPVALEDRERFPDRRDLRGDTVNVRFLALLLRLGDLLDMSSDRACPMLLNAACPLPADGLAHWTKYQRIRHRLTAPDRIEITAECETQEEHRFLQDWCQWLVDEAREAGTLMARSARHSDWRPPRVAFGDTITIQPAPAAAYIPSKWTSELDPEAVFERLMRNVYDEPLAFIRELIQNALDATRCQMYADLAAGGIDPPDCPAQVGDECRRRYPVRVSLETQGVRNELSGESETRQILTVEDHSIGMDSEVIRSYFLQVGRSYYTTDEFRRSFPFAPASRFGIGFLSVFAVSDHVTVETYKPAFSGQDGPLRLVLTGPRNYLLTGKGTRSSAGTRVEVLLREPLDPGELASAVSHWCKRVEFPIVIHDLGVERTVERDGPLAYPETIPDLSQEGACFAVRSFAMDRPGIEGELYVLAHIDDRGESWAESSWAHGDYVRQHPLAAVPSLPRPYVCLHGINLAPRHSDESPAWRRAFTYCVDCRRAAAGIGISAARQATREALYLLGIEDEVGSRLSEILSDHLATSSRARSSDAWEYKQQLSAAIPVHPFWNRVPGMVPLYERGQLRPISLSEVQEIPLLTTILAIRDATFTRVHELHLCPESPAPPYDDRPCLTGRDLHRMSPEQRHRIFESRSPVSVRCLPDRYLATDWVVAPHPVYEIVEHGEGPAWFVRLPSPAALAVCIHATLRDSHVTFLLNEAHPFIAWVVRVSDACQHGQCGLTKQQFQHLLSQLLEALIFPTSESENLQKYLSRWNQLSDLDSDLYPPPLELTDASFTLSPCGECRGY